MLTYSGTLYSVPQSLKTPQLVFKGSVHRTTKNRWTELNWTIVRSFFRLQLPQFGVGPVASCLISKFF
ncbi:uncharacterized protein LACBIDRAFT_298080 [Laccaria bicolor S238N-H82]|uniref:Predicted protein n=1 Tax=Laccaria bicolor (strain S238N-H82 / ATCC MYA-4686) TaxID=486041 RepID=B0DC68_LACBS|nr:uncharacterized protein LACBIDRAFT_298080 [Laccaria bicolor S238N-H82]EDR07842.1 predicted protein [Laccaria bicolor S238N-H82]|eukprot:XP_001881631.1 predicted protein [Laccaria bicolor S238N-H82]